MLFSGLHLHTRDITVATVDAAGTAIAGQRLPAMRSAFILPNWQPPSPTPGSKLQQAGIG